MLNTQRPGKRLIIPDSGLLWITLIIVLLILPVFFVTPVISDDVSITHGTESILSTAAWGTDQTSPAVWEDRVVWVHYYPSVEDPEVFNSILYFSNLTSGELIRIPAITPNQDKPDIWQDRIVWQTYEDDNYEIYLFNLSTGDEERITHDQVNQVNPRIWGDWIVWQVGDDWESDHGVTLDYIRSGNVTELAGVTATSPAIWGDRVVWEDGRNASWGDFNIYMFNITKATETQITTDPYAQTSPSIWGDRIVWIDNRNISPQIYRYDLLSGEESRISEGDHSPMSPIVYGDLVVYVNGTVISCIDMTTLVESSISSDTSGALEYYPDIWGNRVVWSDMRNGDFDIFMYTIGTMMPPLDADYSANMTLGMAPLTIGFTDMSQGQIDRWLWDFGDGNSSSEASPVHTYYSEGTYTVILTVVNPYQRDAEKKENYISIGSTPVPQFSQNRTDGPAPLVVAFDDTSSGIPEAWSWDFGDGATSVEQNPVHIYSIPGIYTVNLSVSNIFGESSVQSQGLITVMDGTYHDCILPSEGMNITPDGGVTHLVLNTSAAGTCSFGTSSNQTTLVCIPGADRGIAELQFQAVEGGQFTYEGDDIITGTFERVTLRSEDVHPNNFTREAGTNSFYNFTMGMKEYIPDKIIRSVAWEGCTPEDMDRFEDIKIMYNYGAIEDLAYTVRFDEESVPNGSNASFIFGVSSDWVQKYGWTDNRDIEIETNPENAMVYVDGAFAGVTPLVVKDLSPGQYQVKITKLGYNDTSYTEVIGDIRDSIHIIRIGNDGSGEVLDTNFIGYDPVHNLDLFKAESPNGLSTFGVAALSKSGSIFQMLYLSLSDAVKGSSAAVGGGGGGGGGGGTYSGVAGAGSPATPVATQTPQATLSPRQTMTPTTSPSIGAITRAPTDTQPIDTGTIPTPHETSTSPNGTEKLPPAPYFGLLRNLAVVAVVAIITVIFYFRWKKQ
jgi:beta propeller repeat protein